jgi:hypothetical protein
VQPFGPTSHFHSDKWPFTCDPRMCHFHSQNHATGLNLASTIKKRWIRSRITNFSWWIMVRRGLRCHRVPSWWLVWQVRIAQI